MLLTVDALGLFPDALFVSLGKIGPYFLSCLGGVVLVERTNLPSLSERVPPPLLGFSASLLRLNLKESRKAPSRKRERLCSAGGSTPYSPLHSSWNNNPTASRLSKLADMPNTSLTDTPQESIKGPSPSVSFQNSQSASHRPPRLRRRQQRSSLPVASSQRHDLFPSNRAISALPIDVHPN